MSESLRDWQLILEEEKLLCWSASLQLGFFSHLHPWGLGDSFKPKGKFPLTSVDWSPWHCPRAGILSGRMCVAALTQSLGARVGSWRGREDVWCSWVWAGIHHSAGCCGHGGNGEKAGWVCPWAGNTLGLDLAWVSFRYWVCLICQSWSCNWAAQGVRGIWNKCFD